MTTMYQVYVIYNDAVNKYYIGQSGNLDRRIKSHNYKLGKHHTARFEGEWKLIYEESFSTRSEGIRREKQLKTSRGRAYISNYIPG